MSKIILTRTEHIASTWYPWRGCARRSVWRIWTRTNVSEPVWISVKMSQRRWLKSKRTVYKVFWRPKGNWWRGIGKRISRRRRWWTMQRPVKCTSRSRNSGFYLWRRRLSWRNSRGVIIRFHSSLKNKRIKLYLCSPEKSVRKSFKKTKEFLCDKLNPEPRNRLIWFNDQIYE